MIMITEFIANAWSFKLSLLPVLLTFLIFEIPSIVRRATRILYIPVYFMFFPLGHSDKLYAEYLNEDDMYFVGASQTPEQKRAVRNKIIVRSILSMLFSTVVAPLICGFLAALYLPPSQFLEFIWFLLIVKIATVLYSLFQLKGMSFVYESKAFYWILALYALYILIIWRLLDQAYHWTATEIKNGIGAVLTKLVDILVFEMFLYIVALTVFTWALSHLITDPKLIRTLETFDDEEHQE